MQKEEEKGCVKITFLSNHIGIQIPRGEGKKRKFFLPWVGRYFARYQSCLLSSFPSFSYMDGSFNSFSLASENSLSEFFGAEFFGLEEGMDGSIPYGSDLKFWRRSSRDGIDPDPWR